MKPTNVHVYSMILSHMINYQQFFFFLYRLHHAPCGAPFGMTLIPNNSAPHTHTKTDPIKYAATPLNQPQRCILNDYFNNYNFSKQK
jgi:hypothetical protein